MSNSTSGDRLTKNERREQAREQARVAREAARKRERRSRVLWQTGIIVGLVAIVAVIALVIVQSVKPAGPGPRNMASDGLLVNPGLVVAETAGIQPGGEAIPNPLPTGTDEIRIETFVDYLCPYCGDFETTNIEYIHTLVESGAASLEIRPVSILDRAAAGTKYSTRAANAFACVADQQPDAALAFHESLFLGWDQRSAESAGTGGLTDDELVEFAQAAGADSAGVEDCIRSRTFSGWVDDATKRASENPDFTGTPTVFVNGTKYEGSLTDAQTFRNFVAQVAGASYVEETSTPAPVPTPTSTP